MGMVSRRSSANNQILAPVMKDWNWIDQPTTDDELPTTND
jgi:hypothetical protein